jgi:glycosyltransferase involved in cell wall biosynthesis
MEFSNRKGKITFIWGLHLKKQGVYFYGKPDKNSGYGAATTEFIKAFYNSEVPTTFKGLYAKDEELHQSNFNFPSHDIDFLLTTPPFAKFKSTKYKIGYFYWEADTLPHVWGNDIKHSIDEAWVPCRLVQDAVIKCGFNKPIHIVPTPYVSNLDVEPISFPGLFANTKLSNDIFKFYSIFQWGERKGYNILLDAYIKEFSADDPVVLILKVNPIQSTGHGITKIRRDILTARQRSNKSSQPRIILITNHLSIEEVNGLHTVGDCFVLPHHGEGWGMPIHSAMVFGKKIITTKYGGVTEHLNDESAMIIQHSFVPTQKMSWNPWYSPEQKWAKPNIEHLMFLMREAYNSRGKENIIGENAKKIGQKFSSEFLTKRITNLLEKTRIKR